MDVKPTCSGSLRGDLMLAVPNPTLRSSPHSTSTHMGSFNKRLRRIRGERARTEPTWVCGVFAYVSAHAMFWLIGYVID